MIKKWKERIRRAADSEYALVFLCLTSFAESSFFIIPPDSLLTPMCLFDPKKWKKFAFFTTIFSVLGGVFGYGIGMFLFNEVAKPIINFYHLWDKFQYVEHLYRSYDFLVVFVAGLTPLPYKVFTIAAGVFKMNLLGFVFASLFGRGIRFYIEAFLVAKFGEEALEFLEKHFVFATIVIALVVVAGVLVYSLFLR
ncbi:conserved hypothetical protein [Thermotomaculum hydrothermale]|uniref:VTT domain-containing protein n=1 Tax=Thermotomaculum hydrothermale TaxID=981385 RepID=A0A7R6PPP4_9BACT|nr:YqaA family protein [Thermotomaculum hydrothermale]BBB33548.1 conserved hypothetical protein [Thermotomaculum hydrothermale]